MIWPSHGQSAVPKQEKGEEMSRDLAFISVSDLLPVLLVGLDKWKSDVEDAWVMQSIGVRTGLRAQDNEERNGSWEQNEKCFNAYILKYNSVSNGKSFSGYALIFPSFCVLLNFSVS